MYEVQEKMLECFLSSTDHSLVRTAAFLIHVITVVSQATPSNHCEREVIRGCGLRDYKNSTYMYTSKNRDYHVLKMVWCVRIVPYLLAMFIFQERSRLRLSSCRLERYRWLPIPRTTPLLPRRRRQRSTITA